MSQKQQMRPPQIVIQPPSPEWTEAKAVKSFNNTKNLNMEFEELRSGVKVRYEFIAELFSVHDYRSQRSGNEICLHDATDERRSGKTPRRSNDLSRKRDSSQHFSKWFGEALHSYREMQKRQVTTFLPAVKEPTVRKKELVGKAASSSLRKGLTQKKTIVHFKTADTNLKHSVSHTKTPQAGASPSRQQKSSGKVSSKTVLLPSHGPLETKRATSKQGKATKMVTESKRPSKHSKSVTKQVSHDQAVDNKPRHSKGVLHVRSSLSTEDCDLHGSVSSTESNSVNLLSHSSCNLFPVSIDQLYEEVETLQPPKPFVPHSPSSNEELSPVARKSSLTNRSTSVRETNSEIGASSCPPEEIDEEIVLPQITIDEVLKSWHICHPRRGRSSSTGKAPHDLLQFLIKSPEATEESPAERLARVESEYAKLKRCRYLRLGKEQKDLVRQGAACSCNSCEHVTGLKSTPYMNS